MTQETGFGNGTCLFFQVREHILKTEDTETKHCLAFNVITLL